MSRTRTLRSSGFGSSDCRRAKASRRPVSPPRGWAPWRRRVDSRFVAPAAPDDVETADDEGEEIVEVVRDAPGELADRLHFWAGERVLDLRPFGDLAHHPLFQLGVQFAQPLLDARSRFARALPEMSWK